MCFSRSSALILLSLVCSTVSFSQVPSSVGQWKFDDPAAPLKAEKGNDLILVGSHQSLAGPAAGNNAIRIGPGSYYRMNHDIPANGGGSLVNEYTLMIDFRVTSLGPWKTFFQTDLSNRSDGDCFINPSGNIGVGATGYTGYAVATNEWYRLVVSVKNGLQHNYYVDGQLVTAGTAGAVDGRFALDTLLLMFADNDGEDGLIDCAELAVWSTALTGAQAAALGGYGHSTIPPLPPIVPYLQAPTPTSVYVCWHDTSATGTAVEYGTTPALGTTVTGTSEVLGSLYRWHTVRLSGLTPLTEYSYRVTSGPNASQLYSFRTPPPDNYTGTFRFLLLSDTHNPDTSKSYRVIRAARKKIEALYGTDVQNQMTAVLHSGDLVMSGNNVYEYGNIYLGPMSVMSANVPYLAVPGNHDCQSGAAYGDAGSNFYGMTAYDSISLWPGHENFWADRFANTLVIGLNTNIVSSLGSTELQLVEAKVAAAQADTSIDFILFLSHHMPYTELWGEGAVSDPGPVWLRNSALPMFKKYSKVVQLTYGHTHGFERGTIESDTDGGDFRIICNGGGGGEPDRWGLYINQDFPFIHASFDHNFFQVIEINAGARTLTGSMYSLGNSDKVYNSELLDRWYRKIDQPVPGSPSLAPPEILASTVRFSATPMSGPDSIMTTRLQIAADTAFSSVVIDTTVSWKDIYGVDAQYNPIDRNAGVNLTRIEIPKNRLIQAGPISARVRYRDHNLRWSGWSTRTDAVLGVASTGEPPRDFALEQNYPNPFNASTIIRYQISDIRYLTLSVYDLLGREVATLVDEQKPAGRYDVTFDASRLASGMYFYHILARPVEGGQGGPFIQTRKLLLVR